MTATYLHDGQAIDIIPATDIPLGAVVVLGALIGVATRAIPAGALGSLCLEGVFQIPRTTGAPIEQGTVLFWDPAQGQVTPDDDGGSRRRFGIAVTSVGATAPTIAVRLDP
jgi:predicted RecA/RadA family phage recombinase